MNSNLRAILSNATYETAVNASYLAIQALWERRRAVDVLRICPADEETTSLLYDLLRTIQEAEGGDAFAMPASKRGEQISAIEKVVSELTRAEVSYDESEAKELLSRLREVLVSYT